MSNTQIGPFLMSRSIGVGSGSNGSAPSSVKSGILKAIELGFRHIGTTIPNRPEHDQASRDAVVQALTRGLIKSRDDLFISCRILHYTNAGSDTITKGLKTFLESQQLSYVDMFLLQWPAGDEFNADATPAWKAMEECQKLGLTKSIAVCNFSLGMLQNVLDSAEIPPAANQVGMQMFLREKGLRQFCKDQKISMTVTSTIGATEGHLHLAEFATWEAMEDNAKDDHKSTDEVVQRWADEEGAGLLLESLSNKEHLQDLLNILH